jgi:hypothetical protein
MSVRRQILEKDGVYFITFTCARWLHLSQPTLVFFTNVQDELGLRDMNR